MFRMLPNGNPYYISASAEPVFNAEGQFTGYRGVSREITHQKIAEQRIEYLATHDALTSLANRALFYDRLRQQLAQASRSCASVAVVNIDMDGLKAINDQLGHRAGDAAICQVAQRIARELRQEDLAARLGGDEFGVILCGVRDRDGVGSKCSHITDAIGAPFEFEGRALRLGASIGYAISPEDGQDMDQLIDLADQAMYRVKQARKAVAA